MPPLRQSLLRSRKLQLASRRRRSPLILMLLIAFWSIILGLGLAQAIETPVSSAKEIETEIGTVDPVSAEYELGQNLYLENCATCHVGIPPAVFPSESWRQVLQTTEHYGVNLPLLVDPGRLLVWNYLRDFSRGLQEGESVPYRLDTSRYFKALHPQVEIPQPLTVNSCATCHTNASRYDFRSLSPEWE